MKKLIVLISVILAALMLPPMAAAAAEAEPAAMDGVYAVLTTTEGETIVDEAPAAEELDEVESYELFVAQKAVLSVGLTRGLSKGTAASSYFSADFTLPGTAYDVFLAGLTAENIEEVQQAVIDSFVYGSSFDLTDLGFIDAEKSYTEYDGDDELCWAASTSDMLEYTGWAAEAGFADEDEVFAEFISSYEDDGGYQQNAIAWFFNGAALNDNSGETHAAILDYPNSGGFLNDYAFDMVCGFSDMNSAVTDMDGLLQLLREGYAVGLSLDIYTNGSQSGGHAVTAWGAVVDSSLPADDPGRYVSLFITDSDSYESQSESRPDASNVMNVFPLSYYDGGDSTYYYFSYSSRTLALIYHYVYLAPFDEPAAETDPDAHKDKINYPDLAMNKTTLTDDQSSETQTAFELGTDISFNSTIINYSDKAYTGRIYAYFTVTDSSGTEVYNQGFNYSSSTLHPSYYFPTGYKTVSGLAEGDYTVTYTINKGHKVDEAFYCNNEKSVAFKVRPSYLCGDINSNGEIDIMDATAIQRSLAGYGGELDARTIERADVNRSGLDIMDATAIQFSLAGYTTNSPVGEKLLYD